MNIDEMQQYNTTETMGQPCSDEGQCHAQIKLTRYEELLATRPTPMTENSPRNYTGAQQYPMTGDENERQREAYTIATEQTGR